LADKRAVLGRKLLRNISRCCYLPSAISALRYYIVKPKTYILTTEGNKYQLISVQPNNYFAEKIYLCIKFKFMALVYLGLGTNLGDKERNLDDSVVALSTKVGEILRQSSFFTSKPWGFESENEFLNAVVLMETNLSPFGLLEKIQEIERNLGRKTKSANGYADRLIDIDILLYDNLIINHPILKIPHPLIAERDFVLIPLVEIAPDLVHPVLGKRIQEMLSKLI
jgi:2-amino-4-hydroxy-6-hydroxymethyldihydropteridine diphosphokinase